MNHLFIDTSTSYCSLNINVKNELVYSKFWKSNNNHSEELYENFSKTKNYLNELDYVGVLLGPGGFNSIRIGISFAMSIILSKDIKIIGIPTHLVQAVDHIESKKNIISVINCGKNITSWAKFKNGLIEPTEIGIEEVNNFDGENYCGETKGYNENPRVYTKILKSADLLINKLGFNNPEDILPIYSKKPSISKPKQAYKIFEDKGE